MGRKGWGARKSEGLLAHTGSPIIPIMLFGHGLFGHGHFCGLACKSMFGLFQKFSWAPLDPVSQLLEMAYLHLGVARMRSLCLLGRVFAWLGVCMFGWAPGYRLTTTN